MTSNGDAVAAARSLRGVLAAGTAARALLWGAVLAGAVVTLTAGVDMVTPIPLAMRVALAAAAIAGGLVVAAFAFWRSRAVLSLVRVALWIEERFPALQFALVTEVEGCRVNPSVATSDNCDLWRRAARSRALRAQVAPLVAVASTSLLLAVLPPGVVARVGAPRAGDALSRVPLGRAAAASRLTPLVAEVTPPAYSRIRPSVVEEPTSIAALVGSTVVLRGRGDARGIVAVIGRDTITARTSGDRWTLNLAVGARAEALRLIDRGFARIVAVEPVIDAEPSVVLQRPVHDSVLRAAAGRIPLAAEATDDYGIDSARFEYIVSSGEGETFKFRSGALAATRPPALTRRVTLAATLSLDSLGLKAGDIVHLRAVARDGNVVTGPGVGVSETRALRIARAGEYDSISVEAAGPATEDKSVVSERMLIMLAEALEKRRPSLLRPVVVNESRTIAGDQTRLRKTVGEMIFTRLGGDAGAEESTAEDVPKKARTMEELLRRADSATNVSADPIDFAGGESPVVAVNKPLLEAYNAMWEASTQLELGEPGHALPHMRRALAAIQKARTAERIYLRGRPPRVVIDINKVRLQGKDKGLSAARSPRSPADSLARERDERFARLVALAARDPFAAVDSLLLLRIDALPTLPAFAAALADGADALRRGQSARATEALARARRSLVGRVSASDSLGRWGVTP